MPESRRDWDRLEPLLDQALDLDGSARQEFLRQVGEHQPELEKRLVQLLQAAEEIALIIDRPLVEVASELVDKVVDQDLDGAFRPGDRVGRYHVLREIGSGGMSRVYLVTRARGEPEETLALKILSKGRNSEELRSRFQRERHILETLRHPHIASLVDRGVTRGGRPYFVMQWIDGQPIDAFCRERRLDLVARVRLFVRVCDAVDAAHRHAVIHRDLKPSNLLVEVRPDGSYHPYVLDFGVAREEEALDLTVTGELIGTPGYMSPEQGRADHRSLDHRSDIFSLGVVLFELIGGRRPFAAANPKSSLVELTESAAPSLRSVAPNASEELEQIVARCLASDPERRYSSVAHLIAALEGVVSGSSPAAGSEFGR